MNGDVLDMVLKIGFNDYKLHLCPQTFYQYHTSKLLKLFQPIMEKAGTGGGGTVAVAVVVYAGRLTPFTAIDNGMPAGVKLFQSKAYSAIIGETDTIQWASTKKNAEFIDFDMRNWTDENFKCFTGGILIYHNKQIIGAVGRKRKQVAKNILMQDNELAEYGRPVLNF